MKPTQQWKQVDIFRHAQSTSNAGLPTDRPDNIPLTELGREQAQILSYRFDGENIPELIVTSPYSRTGETAAPTLRSLPEVPHEVWPIHEFTYLDTQKYKGTTIEHRRRDVAAYWQKNDPDYVDGPGAESFNQFTGRVDQMFNRLKGRPEKRIVLFSHSLTMQLAFLRLTQPQLEGQALMQTMAETRNSHRVPNTGSMTLQVNPSKVKLARHWME